MISSIRRRGVLLVLVVLPDGSRSLIPSNWTDWNAEQARRTQANNAGGGHDLGRLDDLLHLRKIIDALYDRPVESLLFGADKRSVAEFSFYLAIPTMMGAFSYDLYKNWSRMNGSNTLIVGAGFAVSFVCGWFVVRTLLEYVSRHGFPLFAWWRIIVGVLGLLGLTLSRNLHHWA